MRTYLLIFFLLINPFMPLLAMVKPLKPTIILTEYYDYECPHCRNMSTIIDRLGIAYPNVHVVYKPTPILNINSLPVASLILASEQYTNKLNDAVTSLSFSPSILDVLNLSQQLGINQSQLIQAAKKDVIQNELYKNIQLAESYATNGEVELPIFVMGKNNDVQSSFILKGEQPYQLLSAVIQQLEQNNDSKNSNISGRNTS